MCNCDPRVWDSTSSNPHDVAKMDHELVINTETCADDISIAVPTTDVSAISSILLIPLDETRVTLKIDICRDQVHQEIKDSAQDQSMAAPLACPASENDKHLNVQKCQASRFRKSSALQAIDQRLLLTNIESFDDRAWLYGCVQTSTLATLRFRSPTLHFSVGMKDGLGVGCSVGCSSGCSEGKSVVWNQDPGHTWRCLRYQQGSWTHTVGPWVGAVPRMTQILIRHSWGRPRCRLLGRVRTCARILESAATNSDYQKA